MISQLQIPSNLSPLQIKLRTFLASGNCELMGIPFIHRCSRTPVLSLRWWHIFLILPLSRLPHISSRYIPLVLLVLSQACEFVKLFQTDFSKVGVALRKLSGHSNLLSHKVKISIPLRNTFTSYLYVIPLRQFLNEIGFGSCVYYSSVLLWNLCHIVLFVHV